jgi:hypothetical protein
MHFNVKNSDWFPTPRKITHYFFQYMLEYYTIIKNKNSVTFYDSYRLFNHVKYYWSVKSDVYIVLQPL